MSLQSRLGALITAIGADYKALDGRLDAIEAGGGSGYTPPETAYCLNGDFTTSSTVGSSITGFYIANLVPGRYHVKGLMVWRSSLATAGAAFWPQTEGSADMLAGMVTAVTTGTTATTGIVDGQTVAGTFPMVEGRAFRNGVAPEAFGGVDTINADVTSTIEYFLAISSPQNVMMMVKAEVAATITVRYGSHILLRKLP